MVKNELISSTTPASFSLQFMVNMEDPMPFWGAQVYNRSRISGSVGGVVEEAGDGPGRTQELHGAMRSN